MFRLLSHRKNLIFLSLIWIHFLACSALFTVTQCSLKVRFFQVEIMLLRYEYDTLILGSGPMLNHLSWFGSHVKPVVLQTHIFSVDFNEIKTLEYESLWNPRIFTSFSHKCMQTQQSNVLAHGIAGLKVVWCGSIAVRKLLIRSDRVRWITEHQRDSLISYWNI